MNYSRLVIVIGCAVVLWQATALESRHEKTFREWDKNKDEKLTKAELPPVSYTHLTLPTIYSV